jgi:hypothetical protein
LHPILAHKYFRTAIGDVKRITKATTFQDDDNMHWFPHFFEVFSSLKTYATCRASGS